MLQALLLDCWAQWLNCKQIGLLSVNWQSCGNHFKKNKDYVLAIVITVSVLGSIPRGQLNYCAHLAGCVTGYLLGVIFARTAFPSDELCCKRKIHITIGLILIGCLVGLTVNVLFGN